MVEDAKAAERQRLAEALRANLRRRKTAAKLRDSSPLPESTDDPGAQQQQGAAPDVDGTEVSAGPRACRK
jgi:hypothetical protein